MIFRSCLSLKTQLITTHEGCSSKLLLQSLLQQERDRSQILFNGGIKFLSLWWTWKLLAILNVIVIQLLSYVRLFVTPWTAVHQASLPFTISQSLLKLVSIELVTPSNHLILCHPLLLPSVFPSIRVFSDKLALCIRWPKYWSFSFSISPFNEYSGLISFRIDCFDLLAVQGLKSLLQHHSSKASGLWCSAFFIAQLSHPYITAGKAISLTIWTFVGKVMFCFLMCYISLSFWTVFNLGKCSFPFCVLPSLFLWYNCSFRTDAGWGWYPAAY